MATGNVSLKIGIDGVDNASAAVNKAREALGKLAGQSDKTRKATEDLAAAGGGTAGIDADKIKQRTSAAGGAIAALTAAMGPAGSALAEAGKQATALGASANLIPGPVGLAAAAVVGLSAGVYLLGKNLSETAAKFSLLTTASASGIAEKLDLGVDGAVKLSRALSDLGNQALRPSELLLERVADNARLLGQDPADNVAKFIAAWKEGPEAIAKVEQEIGQLGVAVKTLAELARGLNLDAVALGFEKAVTPADELKSSLSDMARLSKEITTAEASRTTLQREAAANGVANLNAFQAQYAELTKQIESSRTQLGFRERDAKFAADRIASEQLLADLESGRSRSAQIANVQVQLANNKQEAQKVRLEAIAKQQEDVEFSIAQILRLQGIFGDSFAKGKVEALQLSKLQLDVERKQANEAAEADKRSEAAARRARGEASAAKRKAELQAIANANKAFHAEEERDAETADKNRREMENAAKLASIQANKAVQDGLDGLRAAKIALTQDPSVKAYLEQQQVQINLTRAVKQAEEDAAIGIAGAHERKAAAIINAEAQVAAIQKREFDRRTAEAATEDKKTRDRITSLIALAGPATAAAQRVAGPGGLTGALSEAVTQGQALVKNWNNTGSNASGIIGAVSSVAAAVVEGEKAKAGVMAISEAAQAAALAFVPGMQAEAAGHAASALLWGALATGILGGSAPSASAGSAAAPSGFGAPQANATGAPVGNGGGQTIVNNFNSPFGTRYELGKVVTQAQKAAAPWQKVPAGV